jgi:protein O-GlcNAc transferase
LPNAHDLRATHRHYHAGRFDLAAAACRNALARIPNDADALHLLGVIALRTARFGEAVDWFRRAIASRPAFPDAFSNLAVALEARGQLVKAENACRAALGLDDRHAGAWNNLGNVLRARGRADDAADAYRQALGINPNDPVGHTGLGAALLDLCRADEAVEHFRRAVRIEPANPAAASNLLYNLHYLDSMDAAALAREARAHAVTFQSRACGAGFQAALATGGTHDGGSGAHPAPRQGQAGSLHHNGKIRVGYVSPDFRDHTVPRFISPALEHHGRQEFEVFLYHDSLVHDDTTRRLQALGHAWRECAGLTGDQLDRLIRDDRIDVLVDLRGHGAGNRLAVFARRPAPVQVIMVGYFDTTGLAAMDWRVTDAWMDPPGETERFHTEQLARLPGGCWCYRPDDDAPDVAPPPAVRNGYVTFGSLNKVAKVSPACARLWTRVLEAVPTARLLLSVAGGDPRGAVRGQLAEMGLPVGRVDFADKAPTRRGYLQTFGRVDVALDTFPFNGITTTCDCLWMGVPVVSLAGGTSVSRAGQSILSAAGLAPLAAATAEAFVSFTSNLAGDLDALRALRAGTRERVRASALCDGRRFARELEAAYRAMWWRGAELSTGNAHVP